MNKPDVVFKFKEDEILEEVLEYIASSYKQHYVGVENQIQTVEYIYDQFGNTDFIKGNILKYASRVSKKEGETVKDLKKIIHYGVLLYYYELKHKKNGSAKN